MLFVRPVDSFSAQPITGTDDAYWPFWSADSRFVAFGIGSAANAALNRVAANGGPPQTICATRRQMSGGTWNSQGTIVFADDDGLLYRVSASGGVAQPITSLDKTRQENRHLWPNFLPDGDHFIYFAWSNAEENRAVYLGSLQSDVRTRLMPVGSKTVYAPPGFLVFQRQGTLIAQPFDPKHFVSTGEPQILAEDITASPSFGLSAFSVSSNGTLIYRTGAAASGRDTQLTWVDRDGKPEAALAAPGRYRNPKLSPDGRQLAVAWDSHVWILDLARGLRSRLGTDPHSDPLGTDDYPVWSPNGDRIVYSSIAEDGAIQNLYIKTPRGAGKDEPIAKSEHPKVATDWSPDGRFILYVDFDPKTKRDLWALTLDGDRKPVEFLRTPFDERDGHFSPDGQWVVYMTDEGGKPDIYARRFPRSDDKWPISSGGGIQPTWRSDGKELFFLRGDGGALMAVDVTADSVRGEFKAGVPHQLFETTLDTEFYRNTYDVSRDGRRFIINRNPNPSDLSTRPINVVINWPAALKKE